LRGPQSACLIVAKLQLLPFGRRTEPLAAFNLPALLAIEAKTVTLKFLLKFPHAEDASDNGAEVDDSDASDDSDFGVAVELADIPVGFRELGLRTERIRLVYADYLGSEDPHLIDVAKELCYFLESCTGLLPRVLAV